MITIVKTLCLFALMHPTAMAAECDGASPSQDCLDETSLVQLKKIVKHGSERASSAPAEGADSYGDEQVDQNSTKEHVFLDPCAGGVIGFVGAQCMEDGVAVASCKVPSRMELKRGERQPLTYAISANPPDLQNDWAFFYCPQPGLGYVTETAFDDVLPNQPVVSKIVSDGKALAIQESVAQKGYYSIGFGRSGCSEAALPQCETGKFVVLNHHGTVQALNLAAPILIKITKALKYPIKYPGRGWMDTRLLTGAEDTENNFNCLMNVLSPAERIAAHC